MIYNIIDGLIWKKHTVRGILFHRSKTGQPITKAFYKLISMTHCRLKHILQEGMAMKRSISWVIIMVLVLSMAPLWTFSPAISALASEIETAAILNTKSGPRQSGNWVYSVMNHGIASIDGYTGDVTSLKIPAEIGGYPVGAIGDSAFAAQTRLTSVTIPTQVFSIGSGAFYNPAILTVTGYDGSAALAWAESNGAKTNSLTDMYLNSGIVDLSGVGSAAKKTGANTLAVNAALSYVLKEGTAFFFTATDKYGQNFWGGRVTGIQRQNESASVTFEVMDAREYIDKIVASSDMAGLKMDFIPDPSLVEEGSLDVISTKAFSGNYSRDIIKDLLGRNSIEYRGITFKVSCVFSVNFKFEYDIVWGGKDTVIGDVHSSITTTFSAAKEFHWSDKWRLGHVWIYGVPGFGLKVPLDLVMKADGYLELTITDTAHLDWSYDSRYNSSVPKPVYWHDSTRNFSATGDAKAGLRLSLEAELLWVTVASIGVEGGVHAHGELHLPNNCVDLRVNLYADLVADTLFTSEKSFPLGEWDLFRAHYEVISFSPWKLQKVDQCTRQDKTISFELNGGEPMNVFKGQKCQWNMPFSIGAPTRVKYDFKGWFLDAGFTRPWVNGTRVTEDITLYAKWERSYEPVRGVSIQKNAITIHTSGADRTERLTVTVTPWDATNKTIRWTSSDRSVATVDANGVVTGISKGTATITGTSADNASKKVYCTVTVQQYVNQINVTASNPTPLRLGTTQMSAAVLPDNATNKAYTWSSSNTNVATVNSSGLVTAKSVGTAVITATASDGSGTKGSVTITVLPIPVASVSLNKTTAQVYTSGSGKTTQLTASILPANADDQTVTWESSNPGVAGVDATGKVTGMSAGTAVITAHSHFNPSITAQCTVTVKQLVTRLNLNKTSATLNAGGTTQLSAAVTPQDATNKAVRWVSSNSNVATVSTSGLVTAVGGGDAVISVIAKDGSLVIAQCAVHVNGEPAAPVSPDPSVSVQSIAIDLDAIRVFTRGVSQSIQLHASVTPANAGNPAVTWSSSNTSVATVDSTGKVTGVKGGTAVITARSAANNSIKATTNVTVEQLAESITLNKTSQSILKGEETVQLTGTVLPANASNHAVKWVSGDTGIAVVDYTGLVKGVGLGDVTITAEAMDGSGVTATFNLTVLPVPVRSVTVSASTATAYTAGRDHEIQLTAEALPVHAEDRSLTWTSSNPAVATVDSTGKVTGLSQGTAVITVKSVSNPEKKASCTVTVKTWVTGIELQVERKVMEPGQTLPITASVSPANATNRTVTWSSNNPNVLTVNASGTVQAHAIGSAVITAKANDGSGVSASLTFTVMENPVYEIQLGDTSIALDTAVHKAHQLTWTVLPAKATDKSVSWFSSNTEVAYVDDMGRVIAVSGGTAVITAQSDSTPEVTAECTVTVTQMVESVFVTAPKATLYKGETLQVQVEVGPSQASNTGVTWTSSNENVATVTQAGLVRAVGLGSAVITAQAADGSGVSDSLPITVEKWICISGSIPNTSYYLSGSMNDNLGELLLTRSSIEHITKAGLTASWTLTGGGTHTKVSLTEKPLVYQVNGSPVTVNGAYLTVDELISGGTDTYTLTCTAGSHSDSITFRVTCDNTNYAENISIGFNDVTVSVGEAVTIPAVPTAVGSGTLPQGLTLNLNGDLDNATIVQGQNGTAISFSASSIYQVTAEYTAGNLTYSVPVTIRVKGADNLVKLPVREVTMSADTASMVLNETLTLTAAGFYGSEQLDCVFTWSSSDETVATVNSRGKVTAKGLGTAVIYAHPDSGTAYGWCTVQVGNVLDFVQDEIDVTVYLGGSESAELANVQITSESASRLNNMGLAPDWRIEKLNGSSADLAVQELDFTSGRDAAVTGALISLIRVYGEGVTSFKLICSAGEYQADLPIAIRVVNPAKALPASVRLANESYTAVMNEPLRINTSLLITPSSAALPEDTVMHLNTAGAFGRALSDSSFGDGYLDLTFSKSGTFTGSIEYTGTNYSYSAPFTVAVADESGRVARMAEEVNVTPGYQFLMVGETAQLTAQVLPADADNRSVVWTSYDETVATVSANGLVTAVGPGTAVIHATAEDADVYGDSTIYVENSLTMALPSDSISVYLDGLTRTVLDTYYLSYASSLRSAGKTPAWSLTRVSGSNLTLKMKPVEELSADGIVRLGAEVSLYAVTRTGTAVYDLTCSVDGESATTRITVRALNRSSALPDHLALNETDFNASVGELIVFEPEIISYPASIPVPADLRVSFELDDNALAVLNQTDYFVSRARSTFSFSRAGTYYANAVYASGNVNYTIPVVFHIADENGQVPVFVSKLVSDPKELFLEKGGTAQIHAVLSPANATDQDVTFTSTNTAVATVSQSGVVTAKKEGYAQIVITPSDSHVPAAVCNVTVEMGFNVISAATSATLYLQGAQSQNLSSFMLTEGTLQRLAASGLTPEWTVTRKSGSAATYGVMISENDQQLTLVTEALRRGGTDVYTVTCTAGANTWTQDFTLQVQDIGSALPTKVTAKDSTVSMTVGQSKTIRFNPVCSPSGTALPSALSSNSVYSGLGAFYDALDYDVYTENGSQVTVAFTKPGTYLLARTWYHLNLQYSALCVITVTGSGEASASSLFRLSDTEYTVYAGGKSALAATAEIYDAFAYEAFEKDITWTLTRVSGSSVTASLMKNGSQAGLYVANVKKQGTDVWRLTCKIGSYTESADITIRAIVPRTNLPDSISLPEDTFTAVAGEWVFLPFDVTAQPAGTRLPDTGKDFWRLVMRDTEDSELTETAVSDTGISVRFSEVGSYTGTLIYESGNARYEVPVYFYITDSDGQVTDNNLKLAGSFLVNKVWMDGLKGVGIGHVTLVDADNGVASGAGAALVKKAGAAWSISITAGSTRGKLAVAETEPGQAEVLLVSTSATGAIKYTVTCSVAGKSYTYSGTVTVVDQSTPKPVLNMGRTDYTLTVGETVLIDRRIINAGTGLQFASASDGSWNNTAAIAAMGYGYETNGDTWVATFYEGGTFRTAVELQVGNLSYALPISFTVLNPGQSAEKTVLRMPGMLAQVEDEAMYGVKANVIDLRGSNVTSIGSKAFGGNENLELTYLPSSIASIADDAFSGSPYVIIVCPQGSYAASWASAHGFAVEYIQ